MEKNYYPGNTDKKTIAGLSCSAEIFSGFERSFTNNLKNSDDCVVKKKFLLSRSAIIYIIIYTILMFVIALSLQ